MENLDINNNEQKNQKNENKNLFSAKFWLIILSVFYIISIIQGFVIISKKEAQVSKFKNGLTESEKDLISSTFIEKESVGIIPVYGVIYQDSSSSFVERGSQLIVSKINQLAKDKNVKAVLLDINSPGGSVAAVQEIYSAIKKAKEQTKKPFVARFGEVSASGGYYIASACDKIVAQSGTITGSIGVIFSLGNIEGLFKKIGVKSEVVKSGRYKDMGSMTREMSKEEREILQSMINDSYESFLNAVSQGRNIPKEKLKDIADGRVFTGNQALRLGLIDKIGDLQDAIDEAGILSGLGKNPPVKKAKKYALDSLIDILDSKLALPFLNKNSLNSPMLEYRWESF
jgi:protease-4